MKNKLLSAKDTALDGLETSQPMQIACPGNRAKVVAESPFIKAKVRHVIRHETNKPSNLLRRSQE